MRKILFKVLALTALITILMINISFAVPGKVNDSNVRVRSGPSTEDTETLTNLYLNDPVEVLEQVGEWYKVELSDDRVGYIFAEYVNVSGNVPGSDITTEEPSLTEKPKTEAPELSEEVEEKEFPTIKITNNVSGKYMPLMYSSEKVIFKKNETLKILDEKAFWSKVSNDKVEAWVLSSYL